MGWHKLPSTHTSTPGREQQVGDICILPERREYVLRHGCQSTVTSNNHDEEILFHDTWAKDLWITAMVETSCLWESYSLERLYDNKHRSYCTNGRLGSVRRGPFKRDCNFMDQLGILTVSQHAKCRIAVPSIDSIWVQCGRTISIEGRAALFLPYSALHSKNVIQETR